MVIRAPDGHDEIRFNWNVYNISVIAKISSYFERSVVTLKLRKEYINTVTYN